MQGNRSTTRAEDVAWAAGLFEGEGCFNVYHRAGSNKSQTQARLTMTDRDAVDRFAAIVGIGKVRGPIVDPRGTNKDRWEWYVSSGKNVRIVIALLLPWLCERRRTKALEVDAVAATLRPKGERSHCPKGHPLSGDNLRVETWTKPNGTVVRGRRCLICRRESDRARMRRRRLQTT